MTMIAKSKYVKLKAEGFDSIERIAIDDNAWMPTLRVEVDASKFKQE